MKLFIGLVVCGDNKLVAHVRDAERQDQNRKFSSAKEQWDEDPWLEIPFPQIGIEPLKCFAVTRDDKYMIHASALGSEGVETCVSGG